MLIKLVFWTCSKHWVSALVSTLKYNHVLCLVPPSSLDPFFLNYSYNSSSLGGFSYQLASLRLSRSCLLQLPKSCVLTASSIPCHTDPFIWLEALGLTISRVVLYFSTSLHIVFLLVRNNLSWNLFQLTNTSMCNLFCLLWNTEWARCPQIRL